MRRWALGLLSALWLLVPGPAAAQEELPVVARVGPWPAVSRLIGYGGRIWLVNSVKGVNHNAAEVWSYGPSGGDLRHERHLFSQDAGQPVVHGGLLYWPFEDSRFSVGWGHAMVTDGERWRFVAIPSARAFHVHAMTVLDGALLAATSAWRAGFQAAPDGALRWTQVYDHPTPERRVSRITDVAALPDRVLGLLREPGGRRLVAFDGATLTPLPGVPAVEAFGGFAVLRGQAHALVTDRTGQRLWRSDGRAAAPVAASPGEVRLEGLAADPKGLWAVSRAEGGGLLWFSEDGRAWTAVRRLEGGRPREVLIHGGEPYVAGQGKDGRGILWGPAPPAAVEPAPAASGLAPPRPTAKEDWAALGAELDRALADPASYRGHGPILRDLVYRAVLAGPPEGFLAARLSASFPDLSLSLIGGAATASGRELGRWILLWGMALSRTGPVPPELIAAPWGSPANPAEKYFDTAQAAIWAAGEIGQRHRATLDALIARLDRPGDPEWLAGDVIGALTAITGKRFGFDRIAWRNWWAAERDAWPG